MTPMELKAKVEQTRGNSFYFTPDTLSFFGDTMENYGVRANIVKINSGGKIYECWELYRKKPVKNGSKANAYFDTTTFKRVFQGEA